jgi:hypothetical protein
MSEKGSPPTVAGAAPALPCRRNGAAHRIPFWPINATGAPELNELNERVVWVSSVTPAFCRMSPRLGSADASIIGKGADRFAAEKVSLGDRGAVDRRDSKNSRIMFCPQPPLGQKANIR